MRDYPRLRIGVHDRCTRAVYSAVGAHLVAVLAPARVERAVAVHPPVGVRPEQVAQPLDQRRRAALTAVAVVVGERGGEGRDGQADVHRVRDHAPPRVLGVGHRVAEVIDEQEVRHVRVRVVGLADAVEEARADDAAAAPDRRHRAEVELPALGLRGRRHLLEALGVGDDLRGIERLAHVVDERAVGTVALAGLGTREPRGRRRALLAQGGQGAREHGLRDRRERDAELESVLCGPPARALLLSLIEDHVDERLPRRLVALVEHGRRDLDQEGVEVALVPLVEDLGDLGHLEPDAVAEQVVGLGDELDVGVLDAVVDHLDVVAGAVGADVGAARGAVDLRRDRGEDLLDVGVGLLGAARHDARAVERALLAARDADAEEAQPALRHRLVAPLGVAEVGVAAVDDRVVLVEQRRELLDHRVDGRAGLDHRHDRPRALERLHELLGRACARDRALGAVLGDELLRLGRRAVVHGDGDVVMGDVAREVGAHHRQAGEAESRAAHARTLARRVRSMDTAQLGPLTVSRLCLGAMLMGSKTPRDESHRMLDRFLDAGGTFVDTADTYDDGGSEETLAPWLARRGDEVVLATKVRFPVSDPGGEGLGAERIAAACDASLRRLGVDVIDLYQVHAPDPGVPLEETLEALDGLVRAGKVRALGASNFPAWLLAWAVALQDRNGWSPFVSLQPQYSLVERSAEIELLPFTRAAGLGVLPWGPLGAGFLSGRYTREDMPAGRVTEAPDDLEEASHRRAVERNFRVIDAAEKIAAAHGATVPQVAIAWLLGVDGVTAPIVGARTFAQLEDVLGADGLTLSADERARLEAPAPPPPLYPQRMLREQVGLTDFGTLTRPAA